MQLVQRPCHCGHFLMCSAAAIVSVYIISLVWSTAADQWKSLKSLCHYRSAKIATEQKWQPYVLCTV